MAFQHLVLNSNDNVWTLSVETPQEWSDEEVVNLVSNFFRKSEKYEPAVSFKGSVSTHADK